MSKEDIVKRLRDEADSPYLHHDAVAALHNEAADEIEYLRQRCEQIDQEWREQHDFIRDRVADKSTMLKGSYHARRICLEAEAMLKKGRATE